MQLEFKNLFYKTLVREGISKNSMTGVLGKGISIYTPNMLTPQEVTTTELVDSSTPADASFTKANSINTFYNINAVDSRTNYESNVVLGLKKKPLSFVSGVLNKHNLEILKASSDNFDKPILFVLKF